MTLLRNPARSRPLSRNVKRLMKMARESPRNDHVEKIERAFTDRDLAYCDMQGSIFMAAVDKGLAMARFAPVFMNSQLAGVIDYSFSRTGGMESDDVSNYLRIPLLVKSPEVIVDTVLWLDEIMSSVEPGESVNTAVMNALRQDWGASLEDAEEKSKSDLTLSQLTDAYEYAYWLGYIYRYECRMHEESSRMVYGAFNEGIMRDFYKRLSLDENTSLIECAPEICRRLDALLVGKLWRQE